MSDQKFKDAKNSLAFSQGLREQIHASRQPPQGPEMAPAAPMTTPPQPETQPPPPADDKHISKEIEVAIQPLSDKLDKLLSMESKEVELKIGAEMSPKE